MAMLVAGAAGFIGSHLTDRLLGAGHRVIGVDNLSRGTEANLAQAARDPQFQFVRVDLSEPQQIETRLAPLVETQGQAIDTVWHLAANSDIAAGVADPRIDLRDTFMTTFNLLEVMRVAGCRKLVFASTSAVYGERPDLLTEEVGPLLPISQYGAMKLASEFDRQRRLRSGARTRMDLPLSQCRGRSGNPRRHCRLSGEAFAGPQRARGARGRQAAQALSPRLRACRCDDFHLVARQGKAGALQHRAGGRGRRSIQHRAVGDR